MDDFLTDQQRADQIKGWLRENGWYLLGGVALGLTGLFGFQQWQQSREFSDEKASALYEELLADIRGKHSDQAAEVAAQLTRNYSSTPYMDQARLALAKLHVDSGQLDEAATDLRGVADSAHSEEIRYIARLRLGRVLAQQGKFDEALKELAPPPGSAFGPRFHEARGDVDVAMGRFDEARTEYQVALTGDNAGVVDRALVQAKLDDLAVASSASAAAPEPNSSSAPPSPSAQ